MKYVVYYKDFAVGACREVNGRRLFTSEELEEFNELLNKCNNAFEKGLLECFPFFFTAEDSIDYTNFPDLEKTFVTEEVTDETASNLFSFIETVGDFPYEQLKETIAEVTENLGLGENEVIINKDRLEKILKRKLKLESIVLDEQPKLPNENDVLEECSVGFERVKDKWDSEAEDFSELVQDVYDVLEKAGDIISPETL